jgi:hypothetical protein
MGKAHAKYWYTKTRKKYKIIIPNDVGCIPRK